MSAFKKWTAPVGRLRWAQSRPPRGLAAWMVYRYLGLKLVSQSWFNLDAIWAFSLLLVKALSLSIGMAG